jgi:hypothetical protein
MASVLRILVITKDLKLLTDIRLNALAHENVMWYWVEFNEPTDSVHDFAFLSTPLTLHNYTICFIPG